MPQTLFDDKIWQDLAKRVADAFQMSADKAARLGANKTARLIAAIPYVAGCDHPDRTALAHLSTFILASSESCRRIFDHRLSDDASPTARLAPIADFQGGDKKVIAQGMDILAAIMVNGYKKDIEKDKKSGEYNPVLSGAWTTIAEKTGQYSGADQPVGSAYSSLISEEEVRGGFWDIG